MAVLLFVKKPQKQFGWEYKKDIHMYYQEPVLNHYDYWPILGQSTRNLIIEGVMFNQDTPWKSIFFIQRCYDSQEIRYI